MKEFMFLFHGPREPMNILKTPEQSQRHMQKWAAWMGELGKQGKLVSGQPLETATGRQVRPGKQPVTDGPFVEGKEMILGGYLLLKAESYDEAVSLARGCPILEEFDSAIVEVRAIQEMKM
ncbi:MAG: hypothetical protein JWO30_1900 [Fibrobacteres bacterium]|nr:hypothetical protein [Fibrobacterota bacterium]